MTEYSEITQQVLKRAKEMAYEEYEGPLFVTWQELFAIRRDAEANNCSLSMQPKGGTETFFGYTLKLMDIENPPNAR